MDRFGSEILIDACRGSAHIKAGMRIIQKIFQRIAVENLTIYLTVLIAAVSGFVVITGSDLGIVTIDRVFVQGEFWHLIVYPFRLMQGPASASTFLWLFLLIYVFYLFSSQLEAEQGTVRFNAYIFSGILLITGGHLLGNWWFGGSVSAEFLDLAIVAAVAYLNPNQQILLFFFIPVRLKWIGIVIFGLIGLFALLESVVTGSLLPFWEPVLGTGNFLLFYGPEMIRRIMMRGGAHRRKERIARAAPASIHRCVVCGMTEHDDPHMDFRYCVDCIDHEYCQQHLHNHEHIQSVN